MERREENKLRKSDGEKANQQSGALNQESENWNQTLLSEYFCKNEKNQRTAEMEEDKCSKKHVTD